MYLLHNTFIYYALLYYASTIRIFILCLSKYILSDMLLSTRYICHDRYFLFIMHFAQSSIRSHSCRKLDANVIHAKGNRWYRQRLSYCSFSFLIKAAVRWSTRHLTVKLNNLLVSGCPGPSIALQVQNRGLKHHSFLLVRYIFCFITQFALNIVCFLCNNPFPNCYNVTKCNISKQGVKFGKLVAMGKCNTESE